MSLLMDWRLVRRLQPMALMISCFLVLLLPRLQRLARLLEVLRLLILRRVILLLTLFVKAKAVRTMGFLKLPETSCGSTVISVPWLVEQS